MGEGTQRARVTKVEGATRRLTDDALVVEEPLELQVGGASLAVMMRTPGHDEELALGFVLSERVVAQPSDVLSVRHCSRVSAPEAEENVVRVLLREGVAVPLEALRRNFYASSSCGICGKATLDNVLAVAPPVHDETRVSAEVIAGLPERLRERQAVFAVTGGAHGAALFDAEGELLVVREDVGRHNAVDKVIGWAARAGRLPLSGHVLCVSGRISYEIAQKALAARIPIIVAVSAPSSLAVQLGERAGLTLVGFVRGGALNVYSAPERVV